MEKVKVVFGIDVETDVGSWTPYYESLEKGLPVLLDIFGQNEVKATFFFTGEAAEKSPRRVEEVSNSGHEVGCHSLYHETVGDEIFPIPGVKPLLPEEVPLRLKKATDMVEKYSGKKPVSFRAPRLWGSTAVVNGLENLGYETDATYPLYYYRKRLFPYHPSRENWLEEGESNLLEIPVFADITRKSRDPYGRDMDHWPVFRTQGSEVLMNMVKNFVSYTREKNKERIPVLCFYFHPWEFMPVKRKYYYGEGSVEPDYQLIKNCGDEAIKQLKKLIANLREGFNTEFVTAKELAGTYK